MWQPVNAQTERRLNFAAADWPILIHGAPKSGSSFFTVALATDLIRRGEKVLFLCAKGEAIRALQSELGLQQPEAKFAAVTSQAATTLADMQLVTLFKKRDIDLHTSLRSITDWSERVVIIKNVEEILTPQLWEVVRTHKCLILSGDFTRMKLDISPHDFPTNILFSATPKRWSKQRAQLPTYIGDSYQGKRHFQTILRQVA